MATALQTPETDSAGVAVARKSSPKTATPKRVSSESRKHGTLVRLGDSVVERAKKVAALRGTSMAEYLTERLGPIVAADLDAEVKKLAKK